MWSEREGYPQSLATSLALLRAMLTALGMNFSPRSTRLLPLMLVSTRVAASTATPRRSECWRAPQCLGARCVEETTILRMGGRLHRRGRLRRGTPGMRRKP
eukprot:Rmarinus@m.28534